MKIIRKEIVDLIKSIEPFDDVEKEHIEDAVLWIESGEEIFRIEKPATPLKHLVCYTVLCDPKRQKILLLEHMKAEKLLPSGGHSEKEEHPYETVERELAEELGLKPEFVFENGDPFFVTQTETVGKTPGHIDVSLWYVLKSDSKEQINDQTEEFKRCFGNYGWYDFEEILNMPIEKLDPRMYAFVKKLKQHLV